MDIDFVILWVDAEDQVWEEDFKVWASRYPGDKSPKRYRDWDNLHYLLRGIERFTPWVRTIHFVTYGHLPTWMNCDHPKINIVNHKDFLDGKNLPVFNCNPIEINLHRIKGLSEYFIFFNDDMFLLKPLPPTRFFKNGLPRDMLAFTNLLITHLAHIRVNNLLIINNHFNKKDILTRQFSKWFSLENGFHLLKSLLLLPWPQITGIVDPHQPQPFLKTTFHQLWKEESVVLNKTSKSKFRNHSDVNQYLFRYWQLMRGTFMPVSFKDSFCIQIKDINDAKKTACKIEQQKYALFCVNDLIEDDISLQFRKIKTIVNNALETLLPDKSEFEK